MTDEPFAALTSIDPIAASDTHVVLRCTADDDQSSLVYLPRAKYVALIGEYLDGMAAHYQPGGALVEPRIMFVQLLNIRRRPQGVTKYFPKTNTRTDYDMVYDSDDFHVVIQD